MKQKFIQLKKHQFLLHEHVISSIGSHEFYLYFYSLYLHNAYTLVGKNEDESYELRIKII